MGLLSLLSLSLIFRLHDHLYLLRACMDCRWLYRLEHLRLCTYWMRLIDRKAGDYHPQLFVDLVLRILIVRSEHFLKFSHFLFNFMKSDYTYGIEGKDTLTQVVRNVFVNKILLLLG